ncbi:MAG TPA: hypothetical protein VGN34_28265 [Ktedonobacteraceae bacterium]
MYTFEYNDERNQEWVRSGKRHELFDDAARAAIAWLAVCFDNDYSVAIRIVRTRDDT